MDYLDFYELNQEPFSNAPVSRFYFATEQHNQALVRLQYAVQSMKGLAILSGGIGAGKTTLARRFLDALDDKEYEAALLIIIHSGITADWLLRRIALQLGVENPESDKLALLAQLYKRLVEIYESGKKAVVLIDEAQMLASRELMEEFRGLLNLEVPERKLLSFVFFGLPEIETNLLLDPPLQQRVALRYRLDPFDLESTKAYVEHRLKVAGSKNAPFDAEALGIIHKASRGVPRLINTICDNALLEGALAKTKSVSVELVKSVAKNLALPIEDEAPALSLDALMMAAGMPAGMPGGIPGLPPPMAPLPLEAEVGLALEEIDRALAFLQKKPGRTSIPVPVRVPGTGLPVAKRGSRSLG